MSVHYLKPTDGWATEICDTWPILLLLLLLLNALCQQRWQYGYVTVYVSIAIVNAIPTDAFPATGHHRPLTGAKLYCLVTEAHVREQLAQGC